MMKNKHRLLSIALAVIVSITMISPWQANDIAAFAKGDVTAESAAEDVSDANAEPDAATDESAVDSEVMTEEDAEDSAVEQDAAEADDADMQPAQTLDPEEGLPENIPADPRKAVSKIAKSQIGYKEVNEENSDEDNAKATKYGALLGDETIAPWDAAFALYALHFAAIIDLEAEYNSIPIDINTKSWMKQLSEAELLADAKDKALEKGDLVFIQKNDSWAQPHAAIVTAVKDDALTVVRATVAQDIDSVVENQCALDSVVGYVSLETIAPEKFGEDEEVTEEETPAAADVDTEEENVEEDADAEADANEDADADAKDEEAKADEEKAADEDADASLKLTEQTIKAEMVSSPGIGGKLSALGRALSGSEKNTVIKLSGKMPEGAVAEAYPVKVKVPGQNVLAAYDIKIYIPKQDENGNATDEVEEWQPEEALNVVISNDKIGDVAADSNLNVFHMKNEKAAPKEVGDVEVQDNAVGFSAESFSIYAVTEEEGTQYVEYKFWLAKADSVVGGRTPYRTISIADGEQLLEPAAPTDSSRGKFLGWKYVDGDSSVAFPVTAEYAAAQSVDIYAEFDGAQYATFMSLPTGASRTVYHTATLIEQSNGTYSIDLSTVPEYGAPVGYRFVGWTTQHPTDAKGYGENIAKGNYHKDTIANLDGSVTLYPVCKKVFNVSFNGNGGLVQNLPVYKVLVTNDDTWSDVLENVTNVTRAGHTKNNGWFDGPDNDASAVTLSGDVALTADTTYYAHWNPASTKVIVKYWKEPVDRNPEHHVPYELIDSEEITVPTGTVLTMKKTSTTIGNCTLAPETVRGHIANGGAKINGGNFTVDSEMNYFFTDAVTAFDADGNYYSAKNADDSFQVSVAEDGSTIIDVWYNRTTYSIKFLFKLAGGLGNIYYGTSRINREFGPYNIRLGEDVSAIWPDLTDNALSVDFITLGYTPVALGLRTNQSGYPEAVTSIFTTPLSEANEELLALANNSHSIELYGRYNTNNINGGIRQGTLNEYRQTISGTYTKTTQKYNFARGENQASLEPYTSSTYKGYVLDVTRTLNENPNVYRKTDNGDGTVTIVYTRNGNYTANIYYNLDTYTVRLNYGDTTLATGNTIKYTQPIKSYLEGNSATSTVFADPTEAAGVPDYMEFGGWYTDEDCNENYALTNTTIMPASNAILYAKFTPKKVTVNIDNAKTGADITKTNPALNMSGSEYGNSVRYLDYTEAGDYKAHAYTIAEFMPTYWTNPVWENHVFKGWKISYDGGTNWEDLKDLNEFVDGDIKIKAEWQDMTEHQIHYIESGKEVHHDSNKYVEGCKIVVKGSDTELYNSETQTTKVLRYWLAEDGVTKYYPGDVITMGNSDITLSGVFETGGSSSGSNKATYTFVVPNGSGWKTYYEEIVYRGERLSPPPEEPTQDNASFNGWYSDSELKNKFNGFGTVNAPTDTTLYASFATPYQATYRGQNEELITVQNYSNKGTDPLDTTGVGENYSYSSQYALIGWWHTKVEPGTIPNGYYNGLTEVNVTDNMTLYPVLEGGHNLSFYNDDDMIPLPSQFYATSQNLNFTWPDPDTVTRENYTFTGKWYTDAARTEEFNWNTTLTEDTTIYAGWELNPDVDLRSNYTVAWWVERADSNGDANDIGNYYYSNSVVESNVQVGTEIGSGTTVNANGNNGPARNVQHASEIKAEDRPYFEYHMAKVSYAAGLEGDDVVSLTNGDTAAVDKSGKTTLNIFISRARYEVNFNLNGAGKITYKGVETTGTWQLPGGGWLEMPFNGKWPTMDGDGTSAPKLEITNGKTYNSWTVPSGYGSSAKTTPVLLEAAKLADTTNRRVTYTLTTRSRSASTYYAKYRFRDSDSDTYQETDYRGKNYDQSFETAVNLSPKDFTGYNKDSEEAEKSGPVKEFAGYNAYYETGSWTTTRHDVTFKYPGTNGNVLDIYNSDGTLYTGNATIYFTYDNTSGGTSNSSASASSIRNGSSSYVKDGFTTYTFYYTRKTHDLILRDKESPNDNVKTISVMTGESLNGKVNETDPCTAYESDGLNAPDGMEFDAWSRSSASVVPISFTDTSETMPDNQLIIYAHWKTKTVTVTAKEDDTVLQESRKEINSKFKAFGLLTPEKQGYSFLGWENKATHELINDDERIREDTIVIPRYKSLTAKPIFYDLNGGTVTSGSPLDNVQLIESGDNEGRYKDLDSYVIGASAPVRALHTSAVTRPQGTTSFAYWSTEPNGTGKIYYPTDVVDLSDVDDTVLYAYWAPDMSTTLIYNLNYTGKLADVQVKFNDYRDLEDGELKVNDNYLVGTQYDSTSKEYVDITYSVGTGDAQQTLKAGALRPGYTLLGWTTVEGGESPQYHNGDKIRATSYKNEDGTYMETQTLYAIWDEQRLPIDVYEYEDAAIDDAVQMNEGKDGYLLTDVTDEAQTPNAVETAYRTQLGSNAYTIDDGFTYEKAMVGSTEVDKLQYVLKTDGSEYEWQYHVKGGNENAFTPLGTESVKVYYNKANPVDLSVTNTIDGQYADMTRNFTYTVSGLTSGASYAYQKQELVNGSYQNMTGEGASGTLAVGSDGKVTFNLGHGQKIVIIDLPKNTEITVAETAVSGYTTKYKVDNESEVTGTTTSTVKLKNDTTVAFTNTFDDESVVPSGIRDGMHQFMLLLLLLALFAAGFVWIRRRRVA